MYIWALVTAVVVTSTALVLSWTNQFSPPVREGLVAAFAGHQGRSLELGIVLTERIRVGERRAYHLELQPGQFAQVLVEPQGLRLDLRLYDPDSQVIRTVQSRPQGATGLSWIASASGTYRLEVHSSHSSPQSGNHFEVIWQQRRPVQEADRHCISGEHQFEDGDQNRLKWEKAALLRAMDNYRQASAGFKACGDATASARALLSLGDVLVTLGRHAAALSHYQQALQLHRRTAGIDRAEIDVLNKRASTYVYLGEYQKVLQSSEKILECSRGLGYPKGEMEALANQGSAHYFLGNAKVAFASLTRAGQLAASQPGPNRLAEILTMLGHAQVDLGEIREARRYYTQAEQRCAALADPVCLARARTAIGGIESILGEKQRALRLHRQSLATFRKVGTLDSQAIALNGIGYVYEDLGEERKALNFYEQALQASKAAGFALAEGGTIAYLARVYTKLGDHQQALRHLKLGLSRAEDFGDLRLKGQLLKDMGTVYGQQGLYRKARDSYRKALSLHRQVGDPISEVYTLNSLGQIADLMGDRSRALKYFRNAEPISRVAGDRRGQTLTLHNLARAERDLGRLEPARNHIQEALAIAESLRSKIASQQLQASYFASFQDHYDLYIDVLMRLHRRKPAVALQAQAFEASERAKARGLLDMLMQANIDLMRGVDPALLTEEKALGQELDRKAERHMRLLAAGNEKQELQELTRDIQKLTTQLEEVQGQVRSASPKYAAVAQPQPLQLAEIQQEVLDSETLLLQFSLGKDRSYLWLVSQSKISSYQLPPRARIEEEARNLYQHLTARQPRAGESAKQHYQRSIEADSKSLRQAKALSKMLLGPVAHQLGKKRLMIVADGALQYLPFEALPDPAPAQWLQTGSGRKRAPLSPVSPAPLLLNHEVVVQPSASTLWVLRNEIARRPRPPNAVAVLADPVFERDDPRLGHHPASSLPATQIFAQRSSAAGPPLPKAAMGFENIRMPRLLGTRQEMKAILALAPDGGGWGATDFEASRRTAMSPVLALYRIVHFATHGLVNDKNPELSGILLSLFDRQGERQNGFLKLRDIYELTLPVDLVVLSGCSTGLGEEVRGEGLVGIVRGFMYAGAARVVASLWKVDDVATAELMNRFYTHMLEDGLAPAAALREAKVEMWEQKRWRSPFYWAGFVLQGEWK